MKTKVLVISAVLLVIAGGAIAADPIDTEMFPLLEKARSAKQTDRQEAVRELLTLREAVSDELTKIVIDANNGHAETRSKAGALFLMGELGLMQCKDLLEREKELDMETPTRHIWVWRWQPPKFLMGSHIANGTQSSLLRK